jgi:hypothetical protein
MGLEAGEESNSADSNEYSLVIKERIGGGLEGKVVVGSCNEFQRDFSVYVYMHVCVRAYESRAHFYTYTHTHAHRCC